MNDFKLVGFWYSKYEPHFPKPEPSSTPRDGQKEFLLALEKIEKKTLKHYYRGWSTCRVCNCYNGTFTHEYKNYQWPEGLIHYVKEHNVELQKEFIELILGNKK